MSLETLPREVLAQIFYGPGRSYLAITLWKCGSRGFNAKLSSSLENVHLSDGRGFSASRYPKMISELKALRSLTLSRGNWSLMDSAASMNSEIRKISSPNLTKLEIVSTEAPTCLFNYKPSTNPEASSNGMEVVSLQHGKGLSRFYDIGSQFPRLEELELVKGTFEGSESIVSEEDLAGLPDTLKILKTSRLVVQDRMARVMSLLPRSLELWDVRISAPTMPPYPSDTTPTLVSPQFWSNPPPHLHTIRSIDDFVVDAVTFEFLPRSLKHCSIITSNDDWSIDLRRTLPPNLDQLSPSWPVDLNSVADYSASKLPQKIEQLTLLNYAPQRLATFLRSLPPTLQRLILEQSQESPDWDSFWRSGEASLDRSFWPSHLTSLTLTQGIPLNQLGALPTTLKTLDVRVLDKEEMNFEILPRGLSKLCLKFVDDLERVYLGTGLPNLKELLICASKYRQKLAPQVWRQLPPSLLHLDLLDGGPFNYELQDSIDHITLPTGLKTFITGPWSTNMFCKLPSSLTFFRSTEMAFEGGIVDKTLESFKYLPTSLRTLIMGPAPSAMHLPTTKDTFFAHLINLEVLSVAPVAKFPASVLQHLNSGLRRINIALEAFEAKDVPFLNSNWSHMSIRLLAPIDTLPPQYTLLAENWPLPAISSVMEGHIGREALTVLRARLEAIKRASLLYPAPNTTF